MLNSCKREGQYGLNIKARTYTSMNCFGIRSGHDTIAIIKGIIAKSSLKKGIHWKRRTRITMK
jgi:hypothetical protein